MKVLTVRRTLVRDVQTVWKSRHVGLELKLSVRREEGARTSP